LTFLIPAEIFPTRYRCTLHGLSAASGKLGSVLIQVILHEVIRKESDQDAFQQKAMKFFWTLIVFSFIMALGFPITLIFLPDVQNVQNDQRRESRTLLDKIAFRVFLALIFPIPKMCLPEQQYEDRTFVDRTLEELAPGISAAERDNQLLGAPWFREHWPSFLSRRHKKRNLDDEGARSTSPSNVGRASTDQGPDDGITRSPSQSNTGPPSLANAGPSSFDHELSYSRTGSVGHEEPADEGPSVTSVPQSSNFSSAH
jgi:PHS family inorganic phosphate transporter-like MFS transporter